MQRWGEVHRAERKSKSIRGASERHGIIVVIGRVMSMSWLRLGVILAAVSVVALMWGLLG